MWKHEIKEKISYHSLFPQYPINISLHTSANIECYECLNFYLLIGLKMLSCQREIFQLQLLPEPHFVRFRFGWFSMTHLKYFKTFKNLIPDNHVIQLRWRKH